ncbi:MAG TPA: MATE family efflux transporter [Candidatus Angelobacter sp.]|nr:MATE family efflux transporter [Candidatus Angelobacter sp.]
MSSIASPDPQASKANWFALIKEAVFGSRQDFTAISVNRAILLLAVPMVLEMAMESLFGIVDIFFVAHLGADATATVGITEGMLVLVMAVAFGLSMGATAVVARRVGEHDKNGAAEAAVQSIALGLGFALLIFAFAFPFAPRLLIWMGATPAILHIGSLYTTIMLSSSGIIVLLFLINAVFRGAGDAAIAMRVLWLANFINIGLDPCLIRGLGPFPRLGVTGASVSTTIGRSIGVLFQIYMLSKGSAYLEILKKHIRIKLKVMWNIFEVAGVGVLQLLVATASWVVIVRMVQFFGSEATAGYTVAIRIVIFSTLPSWGLGSAAATLVGQNLGAKQPERAEQSVWRASLFNAVFLAFVSAAFLWLAPQLVGLFSSDPQVIRYGASCLRIISLCYVLWAYGEVIVQAFNGAGDTWTPTLINFFVYWVVQLPVAYVLAIKFHFGPNGAYYGILTAETLLALIAIYVFRKGRWKEKLV